MSILLKRFGSRQIIQAYTALRTTQANGSHWLPDLKPGPYPRTKEEREAAAKKYNLLPEEYEPYPEDHEHGVGDYPMLPMESVDSKDPWYPWDNEELRKNFGEPVPKNIVILLPEMLSTTPPQISHAKGTVICLSLLAITVGIMYLVDNIWVIQPVLEKQFVAPGVTHYTFELVGDDKGNHN